MNTHQLSAKLASNIPDARFVLFNHVTLVARDKELCCVLASDVRKTDEFIAVISQTAATQGFYTPFWQRIKDKILHLKQEGKLCQQPSKP